MKWEFDVGRFSKSQQKIADFAMKSEDRLLYFTEEEIAAHTGVSVATVSRFWRSIGYASFKELKRVMQESRQATPARKMQQLLDKLEQDDMMSGILAMNIANLEETARRLSRSEFEQAVEALCSARRIFAYGSGATAFLTDLLQFRLNRIGFDVRVMARSGHELYENLVHAGEEDIVVIFGFVRSSPEIQVILSQAKEAGYKTLLITDLLVSEMIEACSIVLQVDRGEIEGFHTNAAPLALVDGLAAAAAKRSGAAAMERLEQLHALRKRYVSMIPK
ncbi:DNA-binding MurR/RpiR family transcriptional regulator [Paenibacillus phyllosphaerae]|uniref:DNA-binding MurR/RpiR family transcriptional regulator n=1 Tax=Paenibacillus phyllosphaerae TaxID=274593 RepID=A0A7W5AZT4_9BACL|nr:MurR/RpiR family transcriptional regulator [Paenibacillus phyllosphaerae]MBB3111810.1 DNA-binding MurR/RpiR family transcriptional regulator [Paenibacillus phyllosphaerae]